MIDNNKYLINSPNLIKDKPLLIVLSISLIVRLIFMWIYPDQHFPDAVAYRTIGKEIFSGDMVTNNIYMPLYPIWSFITGGGIVQVFMDILISVVSVWLVFLLSFGLFKNRLAALISSAIAAIYPHFLFYSVSGLTEVFFTFLLLLTFLLFYKKRFFLAITISILSILVKPTFDFLNPILVIIFVGLVHTCGWKKVIQYLFIYSACYMLIMSPWWMHQYQKYGEFVRLNLGDGIVLYSGNNSLNKTGGGVGRESGASDMDLSKFNHFINPVNRNKAMKKEAIDYITNNPGRFIDLAGIKFLRFWRLWPYTDHYQQWYVIAASLLSYGVILFLSVGFIFRHAREHFRKLTPVFVLFTYLTLVHMITIGSIRYRFPLEPFLIIFAGYFIVDILKKYSWFDWVQTNVLNNY
jgi:4-amino-4-deoxy-L-arabinose transferase-like glycosyltransferase